MRYPSPLHIHDTIGLIAPSSPIKYSNLIPSMMFLNALGYQVELGKSAMYSHHGYLAGTDQVRARDINEMFCNDEIKAIFCLRGGYGSNRILNLLDYDIIAENPKIFVGYSDITSFHLAFYSLCNFATFHGPMVSSNMINNYDSYTKESFQKALRMPHSMIFKNPCGYDIKPLVGGCAKGRVIGGCLSLISPAIGTFYQPNFRDTILFLEDVDETLPRCDKMLHHLKNAGIFEQVNGVLIGNFIGCENLNDPNYTIYELMNDFFCDYEKPVLYGIQSGHDKPMGTIPFGTICTMNSEDCSIVFEYC